MLTAMRGTVVYLGRTCSLIRFHQNSFFGLQLSFHLAHLKLSFWAALVLPSGSLNARESTASVLNLVLSKYRHLRRYRM